MLDLPELSSAALHCSTEMRAQLCTLFPGSIARQLWCEFKNGAIHRVGIHACVRLSEDGGAPYVVILNVDVAGRRKQFLLPVMESECVPVVSGTAWLKGPGCCRLLPDATIQPAFWQALVCFGQRRNTLGDHAAPRHVEVFSAEQSNTLAIVDGHLCTKLYSSLLPGPNIEVEMVRHVGGTGIRFGLRLLGLISLNKKPVAALQEAQHYLDRAEQSLDGSWHEQAGKIRTMACQFGRHTAMLHGALLDATDPILKPAKFTEENIGQLEQDVRADLSATRDGLAPGTSGNRLAWDRGLAILNGLEPQASEQRIRIDGDIHLDQVLFSRGEVYFADFEGEAARDGANRRACSHPLRDVARLLRSFYYTALETLDDVFSGRVRGSLFLSDCCQEACLAGYAASARLREAAWKPLHWIQLLQRVLYEMRNELRHRSAWIQLPAASTGASSETLPQLPHR